MKRTLYLVQVATEAPWAITLDGPSFLLQKNGRAPRRVPFRMLRNVILQGHISLSPPVVLALLQHGIVVSWHDHRGEVLGHLWPVRETQMSLEERLEVLLERRDWHWKYENWRRAEERRAIREALQACALQLADLRPEAVSRVLQRLLQARDSRLGATWRMRFLRAALQSLVQENLFRIGLSTATLGRRTAVSQIPDDITDLLFWWVLARALSSEPLEDHLSIELLRQRCVEWVEVRREDLEQHFRHVVDRLDFFLGGLQ